MSVFVVAQAWKLNVSPGEKLVCLALADQANDEGDCYPSQRTLTIRTGMAERTVRANLERLEKNGVLKRVYGSGNRLQYDLIFYKKKLPKAEDSDQANNDSPAESAGQNGRNSRSTNRELFKELFDSANAPKTKGNSKGKVTLDQWLLNREKDGLQTSEPNDPVWDTAETLGLPASFVQLTWAYLENQYSQARGGSAKRFAHWEKTLDRAVRDNWGGLYYQKDQTWFLTQAGKNLAKLEGVEV